MRGILHPSESGLYTSDPGFLLIICLWFVGLSYLSSFSVFLAASPSCPTLCDPIDGSPIASAVPGILQARILEWIAIPFSNVKN